MSHSNAREVQCETNVCKLQTRTLIIGDSQVGSVQRRLKEVREPNEIIDTDFKNGTSIQYWAEQGNFVKALSRHPQPDIVVVFLGTNNYSNKTCPNVTPILDEIVKRGIKCVWVGPVEVRGRKWPINGLIKQAVTPTCTYVDTENFSIPLEDGVHPTYTGILKWLRAVWSMK